MLLPVHEPVQYVGDEMDALESMEVPSQVFV